MTVTASFLQDTNFIRVLYIAAFALFIYGMSGLTGPKTAVRGNRIASVGMAVAVTATLLTDGMSNWGLIVVGLVVGTVIGVPAARNVKMTAMPQMVALFNGVGGGAVALISWVGFRNSSGYADTATFVAIFSLFGAIVGSVSFWGSNIAFGKLQEILPGRPITLGRPQQLVNFLLLAAAVACATAIVAGGFGGTGATAGAVGAGEHEGTVRSTSAADAAIQMAYANQVIVVPGYGMAVAQAQHAVREMAKLLEERGVGVKYAIHPVAGRMPGHMNVLLAEADVPYDQLKEMDDINGEFSRTDVSLVIGANDVTNPDAREKADSPIYGMPILNVDESQSVIVLKRSMNSGFAGIDNPLFYNPKTSMLFGDAKDSVSEITEELKAL